MRWDRIKDCQLFVTLLIEVDFIEAQFNVLSLYVCVSWAKMSF